MLKRIVFIMIAGLFMSSFMLAQDTAKIVVPQKVKNKMMGMFPQTQVVPVIWVKDGDNYKGSLTIMDKPAFALFDSTGKVVRIEKRMNVYYLPKKILAQLNKQYPGNEILEIFELTDSSGRKTYRTTFKCTQTFIYNAEGVIEK